MQLWKKVAMSSTLVRPRSLLGKLSEYSSHCWLHCRKYYTAGFECISPQNSFLEISEQSPSSAPPVCNFYLPDPPGTPLLFFFKLFRHLFSGPRSWPLRTYCLFGVDLAAISHTIIDSACSAECFQTNCVCFSLSNHLPMCP